MAAHGAEEALRVEHLSHRFGPTEVLHDISFSVGKGELFGFIGPNGAGKTTTIRIVASLLAPTAGKVFVQGIDVSLEPERARRQIGYLADQAGAYDRLTVREYLSFFARAFGLSPEETVGTRLVMTGSADLAERPVGALSRGQRQRVQLARVLLHDPALVVLDEPTSNLDPRARIDIRDLLVSLRAQGKTVFLSSHILAELGEVCTSIGVLERGRLVAVGALADIEARLRGGPVESPVETAAAQPAAPPPPAAPPLGPDRVRLRIGGPALQVLPLLQGGPGVVAVESSGPDEIVVTLYGGEPAIGPMIRHLVAHGIMVVGVRIERPDLERMFLELTQKDGA